MNIIRVKAENPHKDLYWILNICGSAILLLALYGILNTSILFEKVLLFFVTKGNIFHITDVNLLEKMMKVVFVYGRDFLWGYALLFSFCCMFHRDRYDIKIASGITLLFELFIVIFRFAIIPTATMNLYCIFAMLMGDAVALTIILTNERYIA